MIARQSIKFGEGNGVIMDSLLELAAGSFNSQVMTDKS